MKSKLHDSFVNGLSNSFLQNCCELFFRQISFCKNPGNYFSVKFLSVKIQRTIFPSNSFLQKSRELFFRQIPFCKNAENYFSVKFLSVKIQGTIFPSNSFLQKSRQLFFRQIRIYSINCVKRDNY